MFKKEELIFRFNENTVDIALLSEGFRSVQLKDVFSFTPSGSLSPEETYNTEENVGKVKEFIVSRKVKNKKLKVVLALDGIITRLVECPVMKKKELKSFIENNISEYFTLNLNDYHYDYKVLDIEKGEAPKFIVLLVVFPKARLSAIAGFIKSCGLNTGEINIYPEAIAKLFADRREKSAAIFDVGLDRNSVTILEKGRIFLYSRMTSEVYSNAEESYEEILESMAYFLNFYAVRHFSNRVDRIFLIGEYWNDTRFVAMVKEQFGIETTAGIKSGAIKLSSKATLDRNLNWDIIGCSLRRKNIFNKGIDFSRVMEEKKTLTGGNTLVTAAALLAGVTLLWTVPAFLYINLITSKYDLRELNSQISAMSAVEKDINNLYKIKSDFEKKQQFVKKIENDKFNYIDYLDALRNGLPSNVGLQSVTLDNQQINAVFSVNGSTMDKVSLIIAINNMGFFETLEIESIRLDDKETEAALTLKIKKPL